MVVEDEGRERYFEERWQRWIADKQKLNEAWGDAPRPTTEEILQWIHEGREERYLRIEKAIEESRREREQSRRDED